MGSRTRALLLYSLAALLLLTLVTGGAALVIFARIRAAEVTMRERFVERSRWLDEIRNGIYLSGTLGRDYFIEPDGPDAAALLERLSRTETVVQHAIASYSAAAPADPGETLALRGEVTAYWKVLHLMLEMSRKRHGHGLDAYFRRQMAQRRETMLQIAANSAVALDREWRIGDSELAELYGKLRATLILELGVVLAFGLVLSAGAVRRLTRLERETRALSTQLVQAQEQERRAIARELHDEIGQGLSSLLLDTGGVTSLAGSGELRKRLGAMAAQLEHLIEEVRRLALSLRPSMLDDLGLVAALEWQAREMGARTGLNVEVIAEEATGDLPDTHRTCIYRVVQEALQNAARHSEAHRVYVGLEKAPGAVSVRVQDDGNGFNPARIRGLGLLGMEERVAQLGGRFRVHSGQGRGTVLTAEIPL